MDDSFIVAMTLSDSKRGVHFFLNVEITLTTYAKMANVCKSAEVGVKIKKGRYTFEGCVRYTSSEKYNCLH